jgi:pimeloyl-ACP methyl ester carboxylesterase
VSTVIVYVHGLWQRGAESIWLRRRLSQYLQAEARAFSYPSVAADATTNARDLAKYLSAIRADTLHLVGHSLGGLVILKLFEEDADAQARLPPGRIVLLGSPLRGSRTAQKLARLPFGKKIMGRAVEEELLGPCCERRRWNRARELGVIAGDLGVGLGRLVGTLGGPSDGTILVEETELEGTADRLVLRVSHTGMLFSAAVAHAAGAFLSTGRVLGRPQQAHD